MFSSVSCARNSPMRAMDAVTSKPSGDAAMSCASRARKPSGSPPEPQAGGINSSSGNLGRFGQPRRFSLKGLATKTVCEVRGGGPPRLRASRRTAEFHGREIQRNVKRDVREQVERHIGNDLDDLAVVKSGRADGLHIRIRDMPAVLGEF